MNLIPKICEMLGVEIGEEFKLHWNGVEQSGIYRFTNYRLEAKYENKDDWNECSALTELLNGGITIIKLPFEPKFGDLYYWVSMVATPGVERKHCRWETFDYTNKYCGNCFRTETEAEKHKYEIYERLTERKWEEKCDS